VNEADLYKKIGQRIKFLREQEGISQHELALRCDFETSNMCRIESGKTNLTVKTIATIAKALELPFYRITEGIK